MNLRRLVTIVLCIAVLLLLLAALVKYGPDDMPPGPPSWPTK